LINAIRTLEPNFIVLSGDVVNKPQSSTYHAAATYLRNVFLSAGFDIRDRLFIIPGNHDVSFFPKKNPEDLKRLRLYREFLRELFGERDLESRRHRYTYVDSNSKVIFILLDSTLKNLPPVAEGEIGVGQREWVRRKLLEFKSQLRDFDEYTRIAVFHHHCVPIAGTAPSGERMMQLLDAGDVLELLDQLGFHMVMHGHKHVPHVHPKVRSDSSVMTVIGAGTVTCAFLAK
jgi:3',5'-cyclic AMP phosphodiesterase CpdA